LNKPKLILFSKNVSVVSDTSGVFNTYSLIHVEQRLNVYTIQDQCSRIIGKINPLIEDYKSATNLRCSIVPVIGTIMLIVTVFLIVLKICLLDWAILGFILL
jgi:hypothetical protein